MHRIRSDAHVSRKSSKGDSTPVLPLSDRPLNRQAIAKPGQTPDGATTASDTTKNVAEKSQPADTARVEESQDPGVATPTIAARPKPGVFTRFYKTLKTILFSSIFNVLLVFVPVGIALEYAPVPPYAVFAVNAVAIVPLAGLLSQATEAVAASLGDALGALLNVTFGNAVELIIFIIALAKNEIRIVQASLVGSILANLLLILGMCFLFGGLRFREQLYNSTVTQMSACLLSLSVASLVLPTAFHASFADAKAANVAVLSLSRGSSVILLLVYILYLLFQLKSHAYMYESTPQHIIDEESHPGVLVNMMNSSSSSDTSSSSDNDSTSSSGSNNTANRIKKAFRRRRKSSASSKDTPSLPSSSATPAFHSPREGASKHFNAIASGDEADTDSGDDIQKAKSKESKESGDSGIKSRDFAEKHGTKRLDRKGRKKDRKGSKNHVERNESRARRKRRDNDDNDGAQVGVRSATTTAAGQPAAADSEPTATSRVAFNPDNEEIPQATAETGRPLFNVRTLSVRPTIPKILTSTVFSAQNPTGKVDSPARGSSVPRAPYGLRRTNSLPDRLNRPSTMSGADHSKTGQTGPPLPIAHATTENLDESDKEDREENISRPTAIVLLLVSTALVALCAEFLVGSINYMVTSTPISEAFIGLIILPIVGNAAEHVTAVTVATKNKMDLAIGVAVGSSIQIALFVTPVVILLGWCMGRAMSLYFTLFETVSLFVSAFIINFLILDGRSNYLEGALLMAAYVIIAVAAFYYPNQDNQSEIGGSGAADLASLVMRSMTDVVWGVGGPVGVGSK